MKYQDYVIKSGKFIGEFEKMYQNHEDPWGQAKDGYVENNIPRQVVCNYINQFSIKSIVEFGCGLGKTTNFISNKTEAKIIGIDISETSIGKAKSNYPKLEFRVDNITNISAYSNFDCYFFSEITWYLLEDKKIDKIFKEMSKSLAGKYFIHNLVFYKSDQKYGSEYFSCLDDFVKFCPFELLGKNITDFESSNVIETSTIFKI